MYTQYFFTAMVVYIRANPHLNIDIGEEQLLVAVVDDRGVVGAGKHTGCTTGLERLQGNWLGAKNHSLTLTQLTCTKMGDNRRIARQPYQMTIVFSTCTCM